MTVERQVVQLESPFGAPDADGIVRNVAYALIAMRDSLQRGEAPFASHLLYTQMLDDAVPEERMLGIAAGLAIGEGADATVLYEDLGISGGMRLGIDHAVELGRPIKYRRLYEHLGSVAEVHAQILADSPLDLGLIRAIYARNM